MGQLDLAIRGGRVVTASDDAVADIGIHNGTIVQLGGFFEAAAEIDATGKLVLPGGIDAHVHLSSPGARSPGPRWVDDFTSGSAAALAGGVTTIGNMTFLLPGELPLAGLEREAALVREQAMANVFLHPVLSEITPEVLDQIPQLRPHGGNSIKFFTVMPRFDPQVRGYVEAVQRAGDNGLITLIHCEDYALIEHATDRLVASGRSAIHHYPASRPIISEVVATQRAVALAEATGAPVYIVHLSSARALAVCAEAQSRGIPVYVETRPLYLHLTSERFDEPDAGKYVGQPPLREPQDVDALWAGIREGTVHTVCTDHAPWSLAAKLDPAVDIQKLRPGVEGLQVMLPLLYSEGVRTGKISLHRMVDVLSTNVAKLFGLFPRKGSIVVGGDADLVVFDPNRTRTISGELLKSNADYSVFDGWEVTGWPEVTLRAGEVVFRDDEVLGRPGSGGLVARGATQQL
jgi:dihydropyrimidinase